MAFKIPDKILDEKFTCNFCHKYLSVGPVKVLPNKKIKCGRCVTEEDNDGIYSKYNLFVEKSKFKCINRFDGCEEWLTGSEVLKHEEICESKHYNCPKCFQLVPTYLLINHYEDNHKNGLLTVPYFTVSNLFDNSKHYLYQDKDYLFFINFSSRQVTSFDKIYAKINCSFLRKKSNNVRVEAKLTITYGKKIIEQCLDCKQYPSFTENQETEIILEDNIHTVGVIFAIEVQETIYTYSNLLGTPIKVSDNEIFLDELLRLYFKERDIFITDNFKRSYPDATIFKGSCLYLTIGENKVYINLTCFMCSSINYHKFVKVDGFLNQYYLICEPCFLVQKWTQMELLNYDSFKQISFFCKWDCGIRLEAPNIENHERECTKQLPQKCPISTCKYYIKLNESQNHFTTHHPQIPFLLNGWSNSTTLKTTLSPIKQILNISHIYILITRTWKTPYWQITLNSNFPNVKLRAIVANSQAKNSNNFIKGKGFFKYMDNCLTHCYIQNAQSAEYEQNICSEIN